MSRTLLSEFYFNQHFIISKFMNAESGFLRNEGWGWPGNLCDGADCILILGRIIITRAVLTSGLAVGERHINKVMRSVFRMSNVSVLHLWILNQTLHNRNGTAWLHQIVELMNARSMKLQVLLKKLLSPFFNYWLHKINISPLTIDLL